MLAAPLFWVALLAMDGRSPDVSWPLRSPVQFLIVSLVYPVLEELAFRGFVQGALRRTSWGVRSVAGVSGANLATSVAFAALHFLRHPPLWAGLTFFPSLVFGYFRDRSGGVVLPIVLHVFYNLGYFWLFGSV